MVYQQARNDTVAVTTTSAEVAKEQSGSLERVNITIANLSTTDTITIAKGGSVAVANAGVVLGPGGQLSESTDQAYTCWQGAYQVVSSGSGNVAVSETFQARGA